MQLLLPAGPRLQPSAAGRDTTLDQSHTQEQQAFPRQHTEDPDTNADKPASLTKQASALLPAVPCMRVVSDSHVHGYTNTHRDTCSSQEVDVFSTNPSRRF